MKMFSRFPLESLLVGATALLTVGGFWNLYFGHESSPNPYHHLHVVTVAIWLTLLLIQLALLGERRFSAHRTLGLLVLVAAPLLVASVALLSVESARKGVASGQGDFMVVQNVMGTFELALIIVLAFVLRKQRELHASCLVSTALLFMGIAMFFTLIGVVPGYRIEGPETFDRFGKALTTMQYASLVVGFLFFARSPRRAWPFLAVGSSFLVNELVKGWLTRRDLIDPLTAFVGSINQPLAFAGSFVFTLLLLVATGITGKSIRRVRPTHGPPRAAGV